MDKPYQLNFKKLCLETGLGALLSEPAQLSGGHLHRMYEISTTTGNYAIKALNPQVMLRPQAKRSIHNAEHTARLAARYVPAAPAKVFDCGVMPEIDGQHYLVFEWVDGGTLSAGSLTTAHCEKMGRILAVLHGIDFTPLELSDDDAVSFYEWDAYLRAGEDTCAPWLEAYRADYESLIVQNGRLIRAAIRYSDDAVVSHRDLEPKNVIWRGGEPTLIDWESAGFINPMHDLVETALYWSDGGGGAYDAEKFKAFIAGYISAAGPVEADWRVILDMGLGSKLGWLDYSLKRSLGIECADEAERRMGTAHVFGTLEMLREYDSMQETIIAWLEAAGTLSTAAIKRR
jgi:Ser/Thr protein kinase RdoA (MazF antagonist)